MTLTDYVNANRIEYAKKLLRSTLPAVQDVAAACLASPTSTISHGSSATSQT